MRFTNGQEGVPPTEHLIFITPHSILAVGDKNDHCGQSAVQGPDSPPIYPTAIFAFNACQNSQILAGGQSVPQGRTVRRYMIQTTLDLPPSGSPKIIPADSPRPKPGQSAVIPKTKHPNTPWSVFPEHIYRWTVRAPGPDSLPLILKNFNRKAKFLPPKNDRPADSPRP